MWISGRERKVGGGFGDLPLPPSRYSICLPPEALPPAAALGDISFLTLGLLGLVSLN